MRIIKASIWAGCVVLTVDSASAQQIPLSDTEVAEHYAACGAHTRLALGLVHPKGSSTYAPGWEDCEKIVAEYNRRDLEQKKLDQQKQKRLQYAVKRLGQ